MRLHLSPAWRKGQAFSDDLLRVAAYHLYSRIQFSLIAMEALIAMRGFFLLALGLILAYWLDQRYYDGRYSRETGNMVHEIAASFQH
jgi:hypothetical protein